MKKPLIIYHCPCVSGDGFGAAYAAWVKFGTQADYVGADYSNDPEVEYAGREVYIVDFSFPRAKLEAIRAVAKSLVILDHHKTARDDLEGFPGAIFDVSKSGARLAWEYFHPEQPIPLLLQFIEDRDLWVWKIEGSRDFLAYLDMQPIEFTRWHELAQLTASSAELAEFQSVGRLLNQRLDSVTAELALAAEPVRLCGVEGYKRNASSFFKNDLGHAIFQKHGGFAMIWGLENGLLYVNLRSAKDKLDVSAIARRFGGGGHPAAAAIRFPIASAEGQAFFAKYIAGPGEPSDSECPDASAIQLPIGSAAAREFFAQHTVRSIQ